MITCAQRLQQHGTRTLHDLLVTIDLIVNVLVEHLALRSVAGLLIVLCKNGKVLDGEELNVPVVYSSALQACVFGCLPVVEYNCSGSGLHEGKEVGHVMCSCDQY